MAFSLTKPITSCEVTKDLLLEIEQYLFQRIPGLTGIREEELRQEYKISITDDVGTEEMTSISSLIGTMFQDGTKSVAITLSHYRGKELRIRIQFLGNRDSIVRVEYDGDNARQVVVTIYQDISKLIGESSNANWVFHPPSGLAFILGFFLFTPLVASAYLFAFKIWGPAVACLLVEIALFSYIVAGRTLKPYIAFLSKRYESYKKYNGFLYALFISVLGGVLLSLITSSIIYWW